MPALVDGGPSPTYLSITSLVCSEITSVTTQLRLDARSSVSYLGSSAVIPRLQRGFKRAREVALHYGPGRDCMEYLEPFLETIRCEETSGVVTQRALSAVHAFLRAELLSLNPASAPAAMVAVVKAATFCRFEVTDPAADEVVLMCILQLLVGCIECNAGGLGCTRPRSCSLVSRISRRIPRRTSPPPLLPPPHPLTPSPPLTQRPFIPVGAPPHRLTMRLRAGALLSDEAVCEVVHSCFRISSQSSLSELLRHSAESGLRRIVHVLFARVRRRPAAPRARPKALPARPHSIASAR